MAEITVGQLARQTNKDADVLLTQLKSFGIEKSSQEDVLTAAEMKTLLEKINSSKVTPAVKKTTSTMRVGGQHKINVSVKRKRRTDKTVTAPVATTSIGDNASQTVKDVAAVPKASDPKVATLVSVSSNKETKPSVAMPQKSVAAAKEAPKAVAKEPVAKPAIKTGGFNFTSIPKKPVVTENTRTNVAPAAKKAPVKKVFSNDSSGSNTKYKKMQIIEIKAKKHLEKDFVVLILDSCHKCLVMARMEVLVRKDLKLQKWINKNLLNLWKLKLELSLYITV
tara:strand:+ start:555 stop:1394 length:840 start_codon:yes stop_codon:yes gene_type:complete